MPATPELDLLLHAANDALWLWYPATDDMHWGHAWKKLVALPPDALLIPGIEEWRTRLHPDERKSVLQRFEHFLSSTADSIEMEHRLRTEEGTYCWVRLSAQRKQDSAGCNILLAGSFTDISDHKVLDPYTRLPNRILFLDRLERSLARLRYGASAAGILCIRIHLPASQSALLNHDELTQLARLLGDRISRELRPWDLVAQPEALEYAVLLEMVNSGQHIASISERLLNGLRQPVQIGNNTLQLGAAIGSVDSTLVPGDENYLLGAAENAAHLAANQGTYCHVAYDPDTSNQLAGQLKIEQDLFAALIDASFEPWFQPIMDTAGRHISGFEVLARWPRHEQMLEPGHFLPLMERSGLIDQLTWIMLQKGLDAHEQWIHAGLIPAHSRLGFNLPLTQLLDEQFAEQILALLDEIKIAPQRLRLEIRGKAILHHHHQVREKLALLHSQGIQIAIDDAGIDPLPLSLWQAFPLDVLKTERSLLKNLSAGNEYQAIILALKSVADAMHLETVIQGVESHEECTFLREQGLSHVQGFLLCPPLSADSMQKWLQARTIAGSAQTLTE